MRRELEEARSGKGEVARIKKQLAKLAGDIARGEENLLLADPRHVRGLSARLTQWKEEQDRLTAELRDLESGRREKDVGEVIAKAERHLWRLREAIQSADPQAVRATLLEIIDRVELTFRRGMFNNRLCNSFDEGIIYLRQDLDFGTSRS